LGQPIINCAQHIYIYNLPICSKNTQIYPLTKEKNLLKYTI
jgi:hypothetical protein